MSRIGPTQPNEALKCHELRVYYMSKPGHLLVENYPTGSVFKNLSRVFKICS